MVASLCGFGHKSPKRILPSTDHQELKSDQEDVHMKPRCCWSIAKKKKKIQPNLANNHHRDTKKQQQQQQTLKNDSNNNGSFKTRNHHQKVATYTLEEWILSSPGPNDLKDCRQSKKVYPSSSTDDSDMQHQHGRKSSSSSSSLSRRRLRVEGVVINGAEDTVEAEDYHSASTSFTSQSGKIKKKVSFRLPEVADIFILPH